MPAEESCNSENMPGPNRLVLSGIYTYIYIYLYIYLAIYLSICIGNQESNIRDKSNDLDAAY